MAKIPIAEFNQQIQGQISSIDTSIVNRGTNSEALGALGKDIANIGLDLAEKRKKAEDSTYLHNGLIDATIKTNDFQKQDRLANPDGVGHRERTQEFLKKYYDDYSKNAPSEDAAQMFSEGFNKFAGGTLIDSQLWSDKTRADKQLFDFYKADQEMSSQQLTSPNYQTALTQLDLISAKYHDATNVLFDQKHSNEGALKAGADLAENFFDGLANNKSYVGALKMLKDPQNRLANSLSADKRSTMIASIQGKIQTEQAVKTADVNDMASNFIYDAQTTGKFNQQTYDAIVSGINHSNMSAYAKNTTIEKLKLAVTVGAETNKFSKMTNAQLQDYEPPDLIGSFSTVKARGEARSQLKEIATRHLQERNKDINAYLRENDSEVQNLLKQSNDLTNSQPGQSGKTITEEYLDTVASRATANGAIPKVLDKQQEVFVRENIANAQNADQANAVVKTYQASMGKRVQGAFAQAFHGEQDSAYGIMAYMGTDDSRKKVWQAIHDSKDSTKNTDIGAAASIKTHTLSYMNHEIKTLYGAGPQNAGIASGLSQAVQLNARRYVAQGENVRSAVEKSYKELIADNFVYAEDNFGRGALVPSKVGNVTNSENSISSFLNKYGSKDGLKELNIKVDPKYKGVGEDGYINAIEKHGQWILSPDGLGMTLVLHGNEGIDVVYNKDGQLVQKSFAEMNALPIGKTTPRKR